MNINNILTVINRINNSLATRITAFISTVWCVYAFILLVIFPLFFPQWMNLVMYISSSVIQLIALPLIMIGQSILNEKDSKQSEEDHLAIIDELAELQQIRFRVDQILEKVENITIPEHRHIEDTLTDP